MSSFSFDIAYIISYMYIHISLIYLKSLCILILTLIKNEITSVIMDITLMKDLKNNYLYITRNSLLE